MTTPDRRVRHLRLRAGSQADVGRVLPVLEDALRCASLPDTGSKLLLVRRLALGRIARDVNAQALAQVIEQRVAAVGGQWVEGGSAAAAGAAYVSFAGALQARVRLALRLLRGEPHAEWYWPLAVPELRAAEGGSDALRRIAWAMAQWPEARTALPAWVGALVQAGQGARLAGAIGTTQGEALVRHVGLAMPAGTARPVHRQALPGAKVEAEEDGPGGDAPRWLRGLLATATPQQQPLRRSPVPARAHAHDVAPGRASGAPAVEGMADEIRAFTPHRGVPSFPDSAALVRAAPPAAPQGAGPATPDRAPALPSRLEAAKDRPSQTLPGDTLRTMTASQPQAAGQASPQPSPSGFDADPTACAGLLFLLPVLARLGLAQWLDHTPDTGFAQRVLHQALCRLRAPADDPAWSLAAPGQALGIRLEKPAPIPDATGRRQTPSPADAGEGARATRLRDVDSGQVLAAPAPACWSDPLLAGSPPLAQALDAASSAEAQATVWLTAARRWLRRAGRIGLASLVRRPGAISLTPTHADLHFHLQHTDLRVRRLGLDLDPGWLPWFGRVVAFHYHRTLP